MKEKFLIAVFILFHAFPLGILAQSAEIKFNLVEGNNGERLGQINSITQDPHGYMWFSGQGAKCIYRYDGVRMIAYKPDSLKLKSPIPGENRLETVYADTNGMIWVGFYEGMELFNPATGIFKPFVHDSSDPGSLSAGIISAILRDHLGRLWVGTGNGLDRLDEKTGKFVHYRNEPGNPSSLSNNVVRSIYEDRKGVLWIGTGFEFPFTGYKHDDDGGLNRMDGDGKFTRYMHDPKNPNSLINNKVRSIFEDSRGIFWIGTSGDGLHTMDRDKGMFERHVYNPARPEQLSRPAKKGDLPDPITFIREDAGGGIWIGTYRSGINRYDTGTKKITHYESSNGYPDKSCWASFKSREGVLWLSSTDEVGLLYRVDPPFHPIKDINTKSLTFCIHEDPRGLLWVSYFGKGIAQYDKEKKLVHQFDYDTTDSLNLLTTVTTSIFQSQPDTIWLCTFRGVILFDKITNHFSWLRYKTEGDPAPKKFAVTNGVFQIIQGKNGLKWIATGDGLFQYNPENQTIKKYLPNPKDSNTISSNAIKSVLEDPGGDIWAGAFLGEKGINRLNINTGHFRHYLKGIGINCLYKDSKGTIWAGTEINGLYRYDIMADHFFPFFDPLSELEKAGIVSMIEDDLKDLWVITESSIVQINADRTKSFVYGRQYGIRSSTLRHGGICKTTGGEILIGNSNGFYSFIPKEMSRAGSPLKILITDFYINNHRVFSGMESPLVKSIEESSEITLNYNQNNFTFYFAAIDYRSSETTRYYTMLENYDNVWRPAGGDMSTTYISVPPGKYIFRVKAFNIDGTMAEKSMGIVVSPPWWRTTWAYILYGLLLIGAIIGIDRIQKQRTIQKERQKTQARELAQAKEIEKAYTELKLTQTQLIQAEKMASLGELTAGIAHEIQNPLNFVNNFSDINKELLVEMKEELDQGNIPGAKGIADDVIVNEDKISHHGKKADSIVKSMLQHSCILAQTRKNYMISTHWLMNI